MYGGKAVRRYGGRSAQALLETLRVIVTTVPPYRLTAVPPYRRAILPPYRRTALPPYRHV
jgi:hypothetical protein